MKITYNTEKKIAIWGQALFWFVMGALWAHILAKVIVFIVECFRHNLTFI